MEKNPHCQWLQPSLSSDQFYLWPRHPLLVMGLITDTENSLGAWERPAL